MPGKTDFYDVLELPRSATVEDIKKAYRKQALVRVDLPPTLVAFFAFLGLLILRARPLLFTTSIHLGFSQYFKVILDALIIRRRVRKPCTSPREPWFCAHFVLWLFEFQIDRYISIR